MTETIQTSEEHGEVLARWAALGLRAQTLVCFDRHLDLKPVRPTALARIEAASAKGVDALAGLNRVLPFQADDRHAYGLDDFLYPGIRMGMIKRLIWVYPAPTPLDGKQLASLLWDRVSLMRGYGPELGDNFVVGAEHASTRIAGVEVVLTTARKLEALLDGPAWIDFDLDFFAEEDGTMLEDPRAIAASLRALGLPEHPPTMTYSISSGFLPPSHAWIGATLGAALGLRIERRIERSNPAQRSMRAAASGQPLARGDFDRLYHEELEPLAGPGASLAAVLATRVGELELAQGLHAHARELGDGGYWPAYTIGLRALENGDYLLAERWFTEALGDLFDTLQQHAACLRVLCLARLDRWAEAHAAALSTIEHVPLRAEPYKLAAAAATMLGRDDEALWLRSAIPRPPGQ